MNERTDLALRVEDLRRAFDRSFAETPAPGVAASCDLLAIRVAGDPFALRLAEVAGLFVDRVVTPVPTLVPELLGVAGFRAAFVPVYDLRALLGYAPGEPPRWMVSTSGAATVALVFDQFEAHIRVSQDAFASDDATRPHRHVREVARTPLGVCPVVHLASVVEAIKARASSIALPKEP